MAFLLGTALAQDSSSGNNPGNGGHNPNHGPGSAPLCPTGLYSQAQCCGTDVLGVLDVECKNPSSSPSNLANFKKDCAKSGKSAKCCVLPIVSRAYIEVLVLYSLSNSFLQASQDVLCQDAV